MGLRQENTISQIMRIPPQLLTNHGHLVKPNARPGKTIYTAYIHKTQAKIIVVFWAEKTLNVVLGVVFCQDIAQVPIVPAVISR